MFDDFFGDAVETVSDVGLEQLGDSSLFDTVGDTALNSGLEQLGDPSLFGDIATVDAQPNFFDQLGRYAKDLYGSAAGSAIGKAAMPALSNLFTTAVQKYTNLSGSTAAATAKAKAKIAAASSNNTMLLVAGAVLILFFAMKKGRM